MKVFLLEDNLINFLYIKNIFEKNNIEIVYHARTFYEAKTFLKENNDFDLALLDVVLDNDEKTGVDVAYMIKNKPVMFLTGYSDDEFDFENKPNIKGLISKPLLEMDITNKIKKCLEK